MDVHPTKHGNSYWSIAIMMLYMLQFANRRLKLPTCPRYGHGPVGRYLSEVSEDLQKTLEAWRCVSLWRGLYINQLKTRGSTLENRILWGDFTGPGTYCSNFIWFICVCCFFLCVCVCLKLVYNDTRINDVHGEHVDKPLALEVPCLAQYIVDWDS